MHGRLTGFSFIIIINRFYRYSMEKKRIVHGKPLVTMNKKVCSHQVLR